MPPPCKPSVDHPFESGFVEAHPELATPTPLLKQSLAEDAKAASRAYDANHHAYYSDLHACMDCCLAAHSGRLLAMLDRGDADTFWQFFWQLVEGSIVHFTSVL